MKNTGRVVLTLNKPQHLENLWHASARRAAKEYGVEVEILPDLGRSYSFAEWRQFLEGTDAILTVWGTPRLGETLLGSNPSVRFVGHAGGSVAGIVSPFLFDRGIRVCTANKVMAESVARWCLMMTMVGMRKLLRYAQWGTYAPLRWNSRGPSMSPAETVYGVWGFGDISRILVRQLQFLGGREILVCSRSLKAETAKELGVTLVDLETLFSRGRVVHLLQGLNERTKGTVNAGLLRRLQDDSVLINAGRAHLLDEGDFLDSLAENRYTAITDVHFEEPLPENSPFRNMPNLIATPHSGALEEKYPFVEAMLEEYIRFREGKPLQHEVDRERALGMTVEMTRKPTA